MLRYYVCRPDLPIGPDRVSAREMWQRYRDEVLVDWVEQLPGIRPHQWWFFEAPRAPLGTLPGWWCDGKISDPRRHLRGSGRPQLISQVCGVATTWHGVDEGNPPFVESQAAYLERHGLFLPGERDRLTDAEFRPVRPVRSPDDPSPRVRGIFESESYEGSWPGGQKPQT